MYQLIPMYTKLIIPNKPNYIVHVIGSNAYLYKIIEKRNYVYKSTFALSTLFREERDDDSEFFKANHSLLKNYFVTMNQKYVVVDNLHLGKYKSSTGYKYYIHPLNVFLFYKFTPTEIEEINYKFSHIIGDYYQYGRKFFFPIQALQRYMLLILPQITIINPGGRVTKRHLIGGKRIFNLIMKDDIYYQEYLSRINYDVRKLDQLA